MTISRLSNVELSARVSAPADAQPLTPEVKKPAPLTVADAPLKLSANDDQLFQSGDYTQYIGRLEAHCAQVAAVKFDKLDASMTEAWVVELYFLQQRLIGVGNKIAGAPALEKRVHDTLQTVCDLQTIAFNRACDILDAGQSDPLGSWVVYKNTMKKKGHHPEQMAQDYFIAQAKKFIGNGGKMSDIQPVSTQTLKDMPDGAIYEYVVDEYNSARIARCDREPTPGHTLLAMGNDALAAGTMKKFGEYYIVGTMSGHFRTPVATVKHMVKKLLEAGVPKERIVIQEGEAGSPRAIELVHRAEKKFGDGTKALVKQLQEEAVRYNPTAVHAGAANAEKPVYTCVEPNLPAAAREVPIAKVRMQNALREALADSMIISYDGEVARVLSSIEYLLVASECAGDNGSFAEGLAALKHLSQLGSAHTDLVAKKAIDSAQSKWSRHVFGSGAMTPADLFSPPTPDLRRMRVVATLDPRMDDARLRKMVLAGMDVARLDTAHGSHEELLDVMKRLRAISTELGRDVRVQIDLSGPKIRLGKFENPEGKRFNDIQLLAGDEVTLTSKDVLGEWMLLPVDYPTLGKDLTAGDPIFLNDGNIELTAKSISVDKDGSATVEAVVKAGGKISDGKSVNFPKSTLSVPTISEDDKAALAALLPHVDLVTLSFVRSPADVLELRAMMMEQGKVVPIIAKIERREGLEDLHRITDVADAVMVARSDLTIEIGYQFVPTAEKKIIHAAKMAGKPVMVAIGSLEALVLENRLSAGEFKGLHSAVESGADAIMLDRAPTASNAPGEVVGAVAELVRGIEMTLNDEAYAEMLESELRKTMSITELRVSQQR